MPQSETPVCTCKGEGGKCEAHAIRVDIMVGDEVLDSSWLPETDYHELADRQRAVFMKPARKGKQVTLRMLDPDLDPDLREVSVSIQGIALTPGDKPSKQEIMGVLLLTLQALGMQMSRHWEAQVARKAAQAKDRLN